jgi:hypothetical protein
MPIRELEPKDLVTERHGTREWQRPRQIAGRRKPRGAAAAGQRRVL